ncbi:MAG: heavy-metal-associated domain-containing protein [Candidatus Chisholmbacteria bacterium]|nr:heavy-metal-associated domain-containing protein [Candidatus Chisholmbacteria bacterium]
MAIRELTSSPAVEGRGFRPPRLPYSRRIGGERRLIPTHGRAGNSAGSRWIKLMRKIITLLAVLGITTLGGVILSQSVSGTSNNRVAAVLGSLGGERLHKATLSIEGMWCATCAVAAEYNLKAIEGVADAYVGFNDNLDGEGWVVYELGKVSDELIIKAIEPYQATIVSDTVYTETTAEWGIAR